MDPGTETWLNREQSAAYLTKCGCPISPQTLANMAAHENKGKGPPYYQTSWNRVRYAKSDLDAWRTKRVKRIE